MIALFLLLQRVAQLVAYLAWNQGATGSSPVSLTAYRWNRTLAGSMSQLTKRED